MEEGKKERMQDIKRLAKDIKCLREESGLTQTQLGEYLDIDQTMISKIENGERTITTTILGKISALFGIDEIKLANGECSARLKIAFRAKGISSEDLRKLAKINRIALDSVEMEELIKHNVGER